MRWWSLVCAILLVAGCSNPVSEARRLAEAGKLDEAKALLDDACHKKKKSQACVAAAMAHMARGELDDAHGYASKAVELDDGDSVSRRVLGNIHFARREWEDAKQQYQRAAALDEDAAMPWANLAAVHLELGEVEAASDAVDEALERNDDLALAHHHHGRVLFEQNKIEQAQRAYEIAGELDEDSLPTWLALADIAKLRGEPAQELSHLLRCLALQPDNAAIHTRVGRIHLELGQPEAALEEFRAAVREDATASNRRWLARGYLAVGQPHFAAAQLREALRLEPRNVDISVDLALALLGANELQAAVREVDAILVDHADHPEAHFVRGLIKHTEGQTAVARREFEKTVATDPGHAGAHRQLALMAERDEDWKRVRKHVDALGKGVETDAEVQVTRARLLVREGRETEAVNAMFAAVLSGVYSLDDVSEYPELAKLREDPKYEQVFSGLEPKP